MSDSNLSPKSIINFLKFKWVGGSKGSPRIVFQLPEASDSPIEPETFTDKINQQKANFEVATLGQLDTMTELDSTPKKGSKGILKDPKKSRVSQQPQSAIDQDLQSSQNARLSSGSQLINHAGSMNLNESKIKKVTFSSDTKNTEAKRNLRYVRIKRRVPVTPQTIQTENQPFEPSSDKLLTPIAEPVSSGAPRNIFKITRTSDLGKNPKFTFNVNVPSKQQSNDVEGGKKNLLKIPSFEKVLESDTPIRSYPSLQAMLEESPISPVTNSSESRPLAGSLSARNATARSPWDTYFQERENAGSLTPRADQLKPRGRREKNSDYYAELMKKNPLLSPYQPSRPDSKAGLRPNSKNGSQANISTFAKRDFIRPVMNLPPERL